MPLNMPLSFLQGSKIVPKLFCALRTNGMGKPTPLPEITDLELVLIRKQGVGSVRQAKRGVGVVIADGFLGLNSVFP
jgi:hypothetical protein